MSGGSWVQSPVWPSFLFSTFFNSLEAKEGSKHYKHHRHSKDSIISSSSTSNRLDSKQGPSSKKKHIYKNDMLWYNQELMAQQSKADVVIYCNACLEGIGFWYLLMRLHCLWPQKSQNCTIPVNSEAI